MSLTHYSAQSDSDSVVSETTFYYKTRGKYNHMQSTSELLERTENMGKGGV